MTNMGFSDLILIAPQCEINIEAQEGAARAQGPLENLITYESWEEFFEKEEDGLRIGFSRRSGRMRPVRQWKEYVTSELKSFLFNRPLHLIYGPEDAGLDLDDLKRVHHICELPTYGEHGSMNLAHAVLISLFILQDNIKLDELISYGEEVERHVFPDEMLKEWLETLGFDLSKRRVNAHTTLRRILLESGITSREWETLEAIVQQTIRKLKDQSDDS